MSLFRCICIFHYCRSQWLIHGTGDRNDLRAVIYHGKAKKNRLASENTYCNGLNWRCYCHTVLRFRNTTVKLSTAVEFHSCSFFLFVMTDYLIPMPLLQSGMMLSLAYHTWSICKYHLYLVWCFWKKLRWSYEVQNRISKEISKEMCDNSTNSVNLRHICINIIIKNEMWHMQKYTLLD